MKAWEDTIRVALLGTEKPSAPVELPFADGLLHAIQSNEAMDTEEKFLQKAALVFNMRQSGVMPAKAAAAIITTAEYEVLPYCNSQALSVLNDILIEESVDLLEHWLKGCVSARQIVSPAFIPTLFDLAQAYKQLRSLAVSCCGKRGEWLITFNEEWKFSAVGTAEELWQTGTTDQRKEVLMELRLTDPATASQWLQQTWNEEDANIKVAFLEALTPTASEADIPFLESLQQEKSKKVKGAAIDLLKLIPSSAVVQSYEKVLRQSIELKKERSLLGIMSKTSLQVKLQTDEEIFKTGIEKLSKEKDVSDEDYVIHQLIAAVPPSFLQQHLSLDPKEIIELFQKNTATKQFISAIVKATVRFKDKAWAIALMQYSELFYLDILPLLPPEQQEAHSMRFIAKHAHDVIWYAMGAKHPWSLDFTRAILQETAKQPYHYTKQWYGKAFRLMHPAIISELEKFAPSEPYQQSTWKNHSDYITKLITIKQNISKAFQSA